MNEQCPRCGSYKTQRVSKLGIFLILFGSGGCLVWLGFLFPPIWILSGLLILASPLGFIIPKMTICQECNYSWKKGKSNEYKKAIDDINNVKKEIVLYEIEEKGLEFKVVGVTKKNENGEDIQKLLKRIINSYKKTGDLVPFRGMTNSQILKEYQEELGSDNVGEFELQYIYNCLELIPEPENPYDENAIKVYIYDAHEERHHIGYVSRKDNVKLKEFMNSKKMLRNQIEFIGGKHKSVEYDDLEDKEYIETTELTLGVSVFVTFK